MESLTQKLHPGVVINFRKIGGVSSPNNGVAQAVRDATPMEIDEKGISICVQIGQVEDERFQVCPYH